MYVGSSNSLFIKPFEQAQKRPRKWIQKTYDANISRDVYVSSTQHTHKKVGRTIKTKKNIIKNGIKVGIHSYQIRDWTKIQRRNSFRVATFRYLNLSCALEKLSYFKTWWDFFPYFHKNNSQSNVTSFPFDFSSSAAAAFPSSSVVFFQSQFKWNASNIFIRIFFSFISKRFKITSMKTYFHSFFVAFQYTYLLYARISSKNDMLSNKIDDEFPISEL